MNLQIETVQYHRNGISGEPFHAVVFRDPDEGRMLGVVFAGPRHVAVFHLDKLAAGNVAFGVNSWRGDRYEPALRAAVAAALTDQRPPTPAEETDAMTASPTVNPFYSARTNRTSVDTIPRRRDPVFARLPRAPVTASPVPHLTSLYHSDRAGEYGDRKWPGNCGGNLIKDLLLYFRPGLVFDPMSGSGTCADVCRELDLPCVAWDIHMGFDACDPAAFPAAETFDFVWAHPAYWRQKLYADDPRDLSRSPTLEHFLRRYGQFLRNAAKSLKPGGRLAVLMGDYSDREAGFVPLTYHTKRLAFDAGLRQCCTDIVRFSHGASSGKKVYRTSFIPGLHDTCVVFEKPPTSSERSRP